MSIQTRCPNCRRGLTAPDHIAGKAIRCPACSGLLTMPASELVFEDVGLRQRPSPPPRTALTPWLIAVAAILGLITFAALWLGAGRSARAEATAAQAELVNTRAEVQTAKQDLTRARSEANGHKAELDKLQALLVKSTAESEKHIGELRKAKEQLSTALAESAGQRTELERSKEQAAKAATDAEAHQAKLDKLQEELVQARKELDKPQPARKPGGEPNAKKDQPPMVTIADFFGKWTVGENSLDFDKKSWVAMVLRIPGGFVAGAQPVEVKNGAIFLDISVGVNPTTWKLTLDKDKTALTMQMVAGQIQANQLTFKRENAK